MKSISIESLDIISCSSVSYIVSSVVVLLCWCIVALVYCRVGVLLVVHTWSTYILSSCCIVMFLYVHMWSTHLHSILHRNHTWELHWYAADDNNDNNDYGNDDNNNNDDGDDDNRQQHTLNLYIYLKCGILKVWHLQVWYFKSYHIHGVAWRMLIIVWGVVF